MTTKRRDTTLTLILAAAVLATALVARAADYSIIADPAHMPGLVRWAGRVWQAPAQPAWKRAVAGRIIDEACSGKVRKPLAFRATFYSEKRDVDTVSPSGVRTFSGLHVRHGLVAVDRRHWPMGQVFWCAELDMSLVAADIGGRVRGPRRVDVYVPDRATRDDLCRRWHGNDGIGTLHLVPLTTITGAQARK